MSAPEDKTKLWKARHDALYADLALRPGCRVGSIGGVVVCDLKCIFLY